MAIGVLGGALLLSRVGVIALVDQGYTLMEYLFITLFAIPLLTVGVLRIQNLNWKRNIFGSTEEVSSTTQTDD